MNAPKKAGTKPKAQRHHASEIAPGVYVGGWKDAAVFEGTRFCVLDEASDDLPPSTHLPIYDGTTDRAIPSNLDRIARGMEEARKTGQPVIVFCGHGVRRSPLAGAWYLRRTQRISLDEAYAKVRAARPQIETASDWIGDTSNLD